MSSNSLTITARRNHPSSPPCSRDALSAEYFFATSAKFAPCRSTTTSDSASCRARALAVESARGVTTICRNEIAAGRFGCCARLSSQNWRICASVRGIGPVCRLDRRVPLRLRDHHLLIHPLTEHLAPRRGPAGGIGGERHPLRLRQHELLLHLRRENRLRPHDRHDAVDGPSRGQLPLACRTCRTSQDEGEPEPHRAAAAHVTAAPAASRCRRAARAAAPARA